LVFTSARVLAPLRVRPPLPSSVKPRKRPPIRIFVCPPVGGACL
jgi:hypothetical protein